MDARGLDMSWSVPIDVGEVVRDPSDGLLPLAEPQQARVDGRDLLTDLPQESNQLPRVLCRVHELAPVHLLHQGTQLLLSRLGRGK